MCFVKTVKPDVVATQQPVKQEEAQQKPFDFDEWLMSTSFATDISAKEAETSVFPSPPQSSIDASSPSESPLPNDFLSAPISTLQFPFNSILTPFTPVESKIVTPAVAVEEPVPASRKRKANETEAERIKRQKNTESARRSRQRKQESLDRLEKTVSDLENTNGNLKVRLAVLESEKQRWQQREADVMERVKVLQAQLEESHRTLLRLNSA